MKNISLFSVLLFLVINCTSQKMLNDLNIGMDKSEVIKILGRSDTSSSDGESILMKYYLRKSLFNSEKNGFYVKLVEGKVTGYDLLSELKKPQIINSVEKKPLTEDQVFFELKKSKDLLDRGMITIEEYNEIKKKLLTN